MDEKCQGFVQELCKNDKEANCKYAQANVDWGEEKVHTSH